MAVSAHPAKDLPVAATKRLRDLGRSSPVLAGTYVMAVGDERITGWHHHDLHQLEYACWGVAEVETAGRRHFLPPRQAVWIPAGVEHCTTLTRVRSVAVFFDPSLGLAAGDGVRILAVAPLLREMVLHAARWPIDRPTSDPGADAFFAALGHVVVDALGDEVPLSLPTSDEPLIAAAMEYTSANLTHVTAGELCAAIGTSERTLRRAFPAATGMSWRQYLLESRLLTAMALLSEPGPNVLAIAATVGFQSLSAFTRAFRRSTGETPTGYRQRVLRADLDGPSHVT